MTMTSALIAASTTSSVAGSLFSGSVQNSIASANAANAEEIGRLNAQLSDYQARLATEQADIDEQNFRRQVRQLQGSQRVGYAAAGVVVGTGSSGDVAQDTAYQSERDALLIRYNGMIRANDYKIQSAASVAQGMTSAANSRLQGAFASSQSIASAGGSILSGISTYALFKAQSAPNANSTPTGK